VLLKNDAGPGGAPLLPLSSNVRNVALIGPLADDPANMLGSWAGLGKGEDVITFHAAMVKHIGQDHVFYAKGSGILDGTDDDLSPAIEAAKKADIAILALGENAGEMTGEATSRAHLGLPGRQQELLEKVVATGKPVVLLVFSGRPLTLPWAFEHVPSVIAA